MIFAVQAAAGSGLRLAFQYLILHFRASSYK